MDQASARDLILEERKVRLQGGIFFESSRPSIKQGGRITAPATTGPARQPRPDSSMPAVSL